jgi:hypothetical protein
MDQVRLLCNKTIERARRAQFDQLMFAVEHLPRLRSEDLQETDHERTPGWWFGKHRQNAPVLHGHEEALTEHVASTPSKNPDIIVNVADLNAARIRKWHTKHLPVHEPGLVGVVRVARDGTKESLVSDVKERQSNLFFTTDVQSSVKEADIILLSVNTPTKTSGIGAGLATNLVALESAVESVALWAKPGAIIVEKSTVPCRTAQMVRDTVSGDFKLRMSQMLIALA